MTEQMNPADSHGAIDLSASPSQAPTTEAPGAGEGLNIPLVLSGTEENFQAIMATSQNLPVIITMYSGRSLESKPTLQVFEGLAREFGGRFQFVSIDIDANPAIAQAFQIEGVPTAVALIGGRPLPLFQGAAQKEQVKPIIEQVLEAASQMGVTGRVALSAEDIAEPIPPEHEAPLAAETAGDLKSAIAQWERVIELNPRDTKAKTHLARVRLLERSANTPVQDPAAKADALFSAGQEEQAYDLLLDIIGGEDEEDVKDAARLRLLDLFRIAGNTPAVLKARTRLSMLVMI